MLNTGKLAGCTLFITGASRGIGKAIALRAAQDGANIVIAAKTAEPHPKLPGTIFTAAKEGAHLTSQPHYVPIAYMWNGMGLAFEAAGGKCLPCVVDIRDDSQLENAVNQAVARFGGIDILVNNASAIHLTNTTDTPMKKYDLMMNINTRGTFLASKLCIPHLRKSKNPHILNISPPLNLKPRWFASHCAYTMAKYGMSMCVLGMAEELRADGIAVNALWPRTAIATAAVEMLGGETAVRMSRKPDIMADAAYLILTRDSREETGQFLIDDEVLKQHGITDMDQYANAPGAKLLPDYFLDEADDFQAEWLQAKDQEGPSTQATAAPDSTPHGVFGKVKHLLSEEIVNQTQATFLFIADGKDSGAWLLDLKNGAGSVGPCASDAKADVTFKMDSHNLVAMFSGQLNPTTAFMSGKLKISGNMAKAMSLEKLMGKMRSKL